MKIESMFKEYKAKKLTEADVDSIYEVCKKNELYYKYCPPFVTKESIIDDLRALPPKKEYKDKYYIGIYEEKSIIAIMDLIINYPNNDTSFIGFFMVSKDHQSKGLGSKLVTECFDYLKSENFKYVMLGVVEENKSAKYFWEKNGFIPTGVIDKQELYNVVVMKKELN